MAGIIANEEYFHAHKAQFDLFHQDLKNALNWIFANRQKRGENRQKLPPRPRARPSHGLGRRAADSHQRQRSEERDFEVLRNPDAVQPETLGRQAAG